MATTTTSIADDEMELLQKLSVTEKLLLAQAVYETGIKARDEEASWTAVSELLKKHPLLVRGKPRGLRRGFKPQMAKRVYEIMVRAMNLKPSPQAPNSPQLLQVARKYYLARVYELRQAMQAERDKFQATYHTIALLQSGQLDHALTDPKLRSLAAAEHAARQTQRRQRREFQQLELGLAHQRMARRTAKHQAQLVQTQLAHAGRFVVPEPDEFYGTVPTPPPSPLRSIATKSGADPRALLGGTVHKPKPIDALGSGLDGDGFFGGNNKGSNDNGGAGSSGGGGGGSEEADDNKEEEGTAASQEVEVEDDTAMDVDVGVDGKGEGEGQAPIDKSSSPPP